MQNNSGWYPLLHRVLVLPEEIETTTPSGIVYIREEDKARVEQVQVQGRVIAIGSEVFSDQPNSNRDALIGSHVMFGKLSGFFVDGADGKKYRMINDLDLVAVKGE